MADNKEPTEVVKPKRKKPIGAAGLYVTVFWSVLKKTAEYSVVYLIGYLNLSITWIIFPMIIKAIKEELHSRMHIRKDVAKASGNAAEKEAIIAKLDDLPAWVFFPDVERCEWLNQIIKQTWPKSIEITKSLIKKYIEPKIQKDLAKKKLKGFRFEEMILGTIVSLITI